MCCKPGAIDGNFRMSREFQSVLTPYVRSFHGTRATAKMGMYTKHTFSFFISTPFLLFLPSFLSPVSPFSFPTISYLPFCLMRNAVTGLHNQLLPTGSIFHPCIYSSESHTSFFFFLASPICFYHMSLKVSSFWFLATQAILDMGSPELWASS